MKGDALNHDRANAVDDFERVFSPITLGSVHVPNRILMAPMGNLLQDQNGYATEAMIAYLRERGQGGAGIVFGPFAAVSPGHTSFRVHSDLALPALTKLASAIASGGSIPFLQIAHQGANRPIDPMGPSSYYSRFYRGESPREMSLKDIEDVIEDFAVAAERGIAAGFVGIELHAALGYLVGSFYSPHANRRVDDYAGLEGGLRFVARIAEAIRTRCGQIPLGAKINAHEHVPEGIDDAHVEQIAKAFESAGFDFLHVAAASSSSHHCIVCGVSPIYRTRHHLARAELAHRVKEAISIPVIADGGVARPEDAELILERNLADMVSVGRAFIADPHWLAHVRSRERYTPCIRCNVCHIRQTIDKVPVRCSVNPLAGRETTHPAGHAKRTLSVAVVGGGPAGMQAALTAQERGHRVVLYERDAQLGGKMRPASVPAFKRPMHDYLNYMVDLVLRRSIEVHLGKTATAASLSDSSYDAVIVATGSRPILPSINGLETAPLRFAASYLETPDWITADEVVLVVGANKVGCELAWYLQTERGARPILIDLKPREELMVDEYPRDRVDLLTRIGELGIPLLCMRAPKEMQADHAVLADESGALETIRYDKVVVAAGARPESDLEAELRCLPFSTSVIAVGDCVQARDVFHATQEGFEAAYGIGEV